MFTHMNIFVDHLKKWEGSKAELQYSRLFSRTEDSDEPKLSDDLFKMIQSDAKKLFQAVDSGKKEELNLFFKNIMEKIRLDLEENISWTQGEKFKTKIAQDGDRTVKIEILKSYMFKTCSYIFTDVEGLRKKFDKLSPEKQNQIRSKQDNSILKLFDEYCDCQYPASSVTRSRTQAIIQSKSS